MEDLLNSSKMNQLLDWAYDKALSGLPKMPSAQELGDSYLAKWHDPDTAVAKLIAWQAAKSSAAGFLTGLGGLITLPLALPADLAATYYINVRMVAAIAHIRGHDLNDDATRTAVFLCLLGDSAATATSRAGALFGSFLGKDQLKKTPKQLLKKINRLIGARLVNRAARKIPRGLVRMAPVLGGVFSGAVNGLACRVIGRTADARLSGKA